MSTPDGEPERLARTTDGAATLPPPPEEPSHDTVLDPYLRIVSRIIRAARGLFAAHLLIVRDEVGREILRIVIGVALLVGAMMFFFSTAILSSVTLVVAVQRFTGLELLESLLVCLATTLSFASVLALVGFLRLRKPLMPRSRQLLEQLLDGLSTR